MEFTGTLMSGDVVTAKIEKSRLTPIQPKKMPLYLARGGDFLAWLESRAIDQHRPNSRILKRMLRLNDTSSVAAVLHEHAATITDNYWIQAEGEALAYEQIRYQENAFSELALTGSFDSYNREYDTHRTPELTNIGSYEKCWKLEQGQWYLYKQGTAEERYSELFVCRLGKAMGFHMAEYEPEGNFIKTRDFTEGRYNYEPAASLIGQNPDIRFIYKRFAEVCPQVLPQYLNILYLDALCFNVDRHEYNYGFLRDRGTGEILSLAPNFDNNIALISRGYAASPYKTSGFLIDEFVDFLKGNKLSYISPRLAPSTMDGFADSTLPGESIRRGYVADMVQERYHRLNRKLQELIPARSKTNSIER